MADPYQNRGAYAGASYPPQQQYPPQQSQQPQYPPGDPRRSSYDHDDDADYYDAAGRRQSIQTNDQFYDSYYTSPPPPPPRRGSVTMMAEQRVASQQLQQQQLQYTGNGAAGYPQQQSQQLPQPPYSPGYPPGYDLGYSNNNGLSAGHAPYNPAAYGPTRHATTAGTSVYTPPEQRPQRHASAAAPFSPTNYNPNAYQNTPYPSTGGYSGRQPLPSVPQSQRPQQQLQQPYSPGFAPSSYQNRQQFATAHTSYMGTNQPYSPGLPPAHSQSTYQPPPPPPPPHPPSSPGFYQGQPPMYGNSSGQPQNTGYLAPARPDTHYNSGSESDVGVPDQDYGRHPLPTPPARDPRYESGYTNQQPLPSPPPPAPPSHSSGGLGRSDSRPLPQLPVASPMSPTGASESLFDNVEDALTRMGSEPPDRDSYQGRNGANGRLDSVYDYYSNSSDMEAFQGLEQMRQDEEYEIEQHKRQSASAPIRPPERRETDESDLGYDISGYAGDIGFYGADFGPADSLTTSEPYYPQQSEYTNRADSGKGAPLPPLPVGAPPMTATSSQYELPDESTLHPFPMNTARVDSCGTGGLTKPKPVPERRMSFDEGSEKLDAPYPQHDDDSDDDFPELFYYPPEPTSSSNLPPLNRPLPSPPYGGGESYIPELRPAGTLPYPDSGPPMGGPGNRSSLPGGGYQSAESYSQMVLGQQLGLNIPRASSMSHDSRTTPSITPVRSKTDGRINNKANRASVAGPLEPDLPVGLAPSDLPVIPLTRKFDPKKLGGRDFRRCAEPWALSSIADWLKEITNNEIDLKEVALADAVAALFTHFVPTMNVADAETLAAKVVGGFMKEKKLVKEEEWVKFGDGEVSGVIYQITGSGCYSSKLHDIDAPGRCYSHHCARTLKKINLSQYDANQQQKAKEDWATYWKIKLEDISDVNKKEIERQNNLHEIVQTEEEYVEHLHILKAVYRDQIANAKPPLLKPTKVDGFVKDVFGMADAVRKVSEEHLLPHLKFRQREQGPWIVGFSDIFREWIRKAKQAYLDYAAAFPRADMVVRREAERNLLFRTFLEQCRQDPRTHRLDWVTFLKGPITRLQRYSLLLSTVLKHTITETEEKHNLERAIEEIKAVTLDCDQRVDEMSKRVQIVELGGRLMLREWTIELQLEDRGRELIFRGDLQRMGGNRFSWLETHCILFDHYLIIAKAVQHRDGSGGNKHMRYDVSRIPIPMDLLVLESTDDEPVVRGAASKFGIAAPTTQARVDLRGRHNTLNVVPQLPHSNSSASIQSTATAPGRLVTNLSANDNNEKILYPFRIKHLGNAARFSKADENTYTLYAPSAQNRKDWCDKIVYAKEKHATSLHAQNAEPFRLKVIADSAFGVEPGTPIGPRQVKVRGTPLDRAIQEVQKRYEDDGPHMPNIISRATVNCATAFVTQYGKEMVAIGTDAGVYVTDADSPRGWGRAIQATRVTQIAVLEEFSLFLVLADKALIAYHLDSVIPPPRAGSGSASLPVMAPVKQRPPQKLSGAKDVGFFSTGRMKDRTLVFYKKREGLSSTFKVLEPVLQKSTERRSRFSRKGTTDFFREFDEFYIPTECFGLNLFHSSLAIQTAKGFEVMTLDKKKPWSVPELSAPHCQDIANRIQNQKPLGMFRLSDIEFLLCYEECAVYVNKHGDVSRSVIMEYVGKAKTVALYAPYVLIFDQDFVEIRNAQNGRLRQVIAGRDVRCIDDAMNGGSGLAAAPPAVLANGAGANGVGGVVKGRTVKVAMTHPNVDGRQLVVELLINEGQTE